MFWTLKMTPFTLLLLHFGLATVWATFYIKFASFFQSSVHTAHDDHFDFFSAKKLFDQSIFLLNVFQKVLE